MSKTDLNKIDLNKTDTDVTKETIEVKTEQNPPTPQTSIIEPTVKSTNVAFATFADFDAAFDVFSEEEKLLRKKYKFESQLAYEHVKILLWSIITKFQELAGQLQARLHHSTELPPAVVPDLFNFSIRQDYCSELENYSNYSNGFCFATLQLLAKKFNWRYQKATATDLNCVNKKDLKPGDTVDSLLKVFGGEKEITKDLYPKFKTLPLLHNFDQNGNVWPTPRLKSQILARQIRNADSLHQNTLVLGAVIDDDGKDVIFKELQKLPGKFAHNKTKNSFILVLIKFNWITYLYHFFTKKEELKSKDHYYKIHSFLKIPSELTPEQIQGIPTDKWIEDQATQIFTGLISNFDVTTPIPPENIINLPETTKGDDIYRAIKILKSFLPFQKEEQKLKKQSEEALRSLNPNPSPQIQNVQRPFSPSPRTQDAPRSFGPVQTPTSGAQFFPAVDSPQDNQKPTPATQSSGLNS